jgi:hypothetical protein
MDVKWEKVIYSVACRKRIFNSTADAINALDIIAQKRSEGLENKNAIRYYFCKGCKCYHLTSKEAWDREKDEELPKINYIPFLPWEPKKESE